MKINYEFYKGEDLYSDGEIEKQIIRPRVYVDVVKMGYAMGRS